MSPISLKLTLLLFLLIWIFPALRHPLVASDQFCYLKKLVLTACTWKITCYFVMSERQEATVSESLKVTA